MTQDNQSQGLLEATAMDSVPDHASDAITDSNGDGGREQVSAGERSVESVSSTSLSGLGALVPAVGPVSTDADARTRFAMPVYAVAALAAWGALAGGVFLNSQSGRVARAPQAVQPSAQALSGVLQQNYDRKRDRAAAALSVGELLEPAPQPVADTDTGLMTHTVAQGDTLNGIASQYAMPVDAIAASNDLDSTSFLQVGQSLVLPRGRGIVYSVQPGDTLESIAQLHNIQPDAIVQSTPLKNPRALQLDQQLVLPGDPDQLLAARADAIAEQARLEEELRAEAVTQMASEMVIPDQDYTVQPGDTLGYIASQFGLSEQTLIAANPSVNPALLQIGQQVTVPGQLAATGGATSPAAPLVRQYTVQSGDTMDEVSRQFGVSQQALMSVNPNLEPSRLQAGQVLTLPSGAVGDADVQLAYATSSTASGFAWPVAGSVSSGFGWRWGRMHNGVDIAGPYGTPIHSVLDGTVIYSGWHGGYGNAVKVRHPNGLVTLYAHGTQLYVSQGQAVGRGEVLMSRGSTGWSTGPHLHFEVHLDGRPVDPMPYLR